MDTSSEQWVHRCLDGKPEAFRLLVRQYEEPLRKYLVVRLGNEAEALEASQETFVRAYFALDRLKKPESFFSWLLGIARRVAAEAIRARRKRLTVTGSALESIEDAPCLSEPERPQLRSAVNRLPDKYRQVIVLRFFSGMSCTEVGHHLDIPLGTVTKRLSRAYTMLRKSLENQPDGLDAEAQK